MVDEVEQLAIDRLKQLFGADHANVQPHSGAQANFAAFMALIKPGDTLMGMSLPHGGHLSHGAPVNHSGVVWHAVHYGVDPATGRIDYDDGPRAGPREQPKLIIAGGSAYARDHRFRGVPLDRGRGRRDLPGGHGALRRPGRRRRVPVAGAACPCGDEHDPQDPARSARGTDPLQRGARQGIDKAVFPGPRAVRSST